MPRKKHVFHDGKGGAALAVRVTPRASSDEIAEILNNGTIRVRLTASGDDHQINQALIKFLSGILQTSGTKIEIVAGLAGYDKLISILDMDADTVHHRILKNLK